MGRERTKGKTAKPGRNERCPCGSGLKFKRCCLQRPSMVHRSQPVVVEKVRPMTFPQLAELLQLMPHHPVSYAATATRYLRRQVEMLDCQTDEGIHARDAGTLVLAAFYRNGVTPLEEKNIPCGTDSEAERLLDGLRRHVSSGWYGNPRNAHAMALQILCGQGMLGGQAPFQALRAAFLLEIDDCTALTRASPYDKYFDAEFGCTALEYLGLAWMTWLTAATKDPFVDPLTLASTSERWARFGPILGRIMKAASCRTDQVRQHVDDHLRGHDLEGVVPAFFSTFPFLEFRRDEYFLGPHPYVRAFALNGPWFKALELERAEHLAAGNERADSPGTQRMGARFEDFVEKIAEGIFNPDQMVREHNYLRKGTALSPDRFVFEKPDCCTIMQAKLKRLSRGAFFGFDVGAFEKDAREALAASVWKSIKYVYRISDPDQRARLNDEGSVVAQRLLACKRVFLLGVVAAMPSVFHVDIFRKHIELAIDERLSEQERAWYRGGKHNIVGWHILDSEELAYFSMYTRREALTDMLHDYVSLPDFGKMISPQGVLSPFRDYVARRGRSLGRVPQMKMADDAVQRIGAFTAEMMGWDGPPHGIRR